MGISHKVEDTHNIVHRPKEVKQTKKAQVRMFESQLEREISSHIRQMEEDNWVRDGTGKGMVGFRIR